MSVVVAIKENGKVYMGCDSQSTYGNSRITLKNPNNYKIWKVPDSKNCLMGCVGRKRDSNVIRLMGGIVDDYDEYYKRINYKFVVKYLVPAIIKELKKVGYLKSDDHFESMDSSYLFAYKDNLFWISDDGTVLEVDDYVAIGSGASEAIGSLLSTENEEPKSRIVKAIKASAANDIYVDYPIIISDTETTEFDVITEKIMSASEEN